MNTTTNNVRWYKRTSATICLCLLHEARTLRAINKHSHTNDIPNDLYVTQFNIFLLYSYANGTHRAAAALRLCCAIVVVRVLCYTNTSSEMSVGLQSEHAKIVNFLTHNTHFSAVSDKNDGIATNFAKQLVFLTRESNSLIVCVWIFGFSIWILCVVAPFHFFSSSPRENSFRSVVFFSFGFFYFILLTTITSKQQKVNMHQSPITIGH